MRCLRSLCCSVLVLLYALVASPQGPTLTSQINGLWTGTLDVGALRLRFAFHLQDGKGTFDSIDQGGAGMPLDSVKVEGKHVSMASNRIHATYEAELLEDGQTMQGVWRQGSNALPLALKRSSSMPELKRPQTPKPPFPYKQEEVSFPSVNKTVTLAGTLTVPSGSGPFPAVLLITGSGPQDRDETIMGHKPFLVIADYLTRHGIAVLRADDRGTGKSTGNFMGSTTADFAEDAEGGVRFLKGRKEVAEIGLLGHSEGAIIAPMLANRNPDVKFVVLMAGTAVPGDQVLIEQNRLVMKALGLPGSFAEQNLNRLRLILEAERSEPDPKLAAEKARKAVGQIDPALKDQVEGQIQQTLTPWFHWFINYDPAPALKALKQPVLALNGSLDVQVSADQNVPAMNRLLAGNKDHEIHRIDGANHLFQHATSGSPQEYSAIEETISPDVLSVLAEWIGKHAHK